MLRRRQAVDDLVSVSNDADHWNAINPDGPQIRIPFDLTDDVLERKAQPAPEQQAG